MSTDPQTAADRIRTYLRLLPAAAHNLGGEIAYSEEFRSEDWPRSCYAPTRDDVEALLAELSRAQAEAHQYRTALQGAARKAAAPVAAPPTGQAAEERARISAKLWEIAEHHIVAEWICCEPLEPKHTLCAKGYAALGMARTLLVDSPEAWNPEAPLLNAVLAELEQLRRQRDLAIAHDRQPYPTAWAYEQACEALRRKTEAIEQVREWAAGLDAVARQVGGPDTRHPVADHIRQLLETPPDEDQAEDATLVAPSAAAPNGTGSGVAASGDRTAVLRDYVNRTGVRLTAGCPDHGPVGSWLRACHCEAINELWKAFRERTGGDPSRLAAETPGPETQGAALKRAHVALAEQAGRDQAALARIRRLHDNLAAETDLASPDDEITRGAAAERIAAALDGWTAPEQPKRPLMDPVHILGIEADDRQQPEPRQSCACGQDGCEYCDVDEADEEPPEVVHACPPDGSGLTPCCGRTPFELPLTDRISSEAPVTCATAPAVVAEPGKEA